MSRMVEVLEVFADAAGADDYARREAGVWRQWMSPDVAASTLHLQAGAARTRRWYDKVAALGLCVKCSQRSRPGRRLCAVCHEKQMEAQRARRAMQRQKLPDERAGLTHHFTIIAKTPDGDGVYEVDGYIITGCYPDGRVGEVFLRTGKAGSSEALIDQWAMASSYALQCGADFKGYFEKFKGQRFEPSGATKNPDIPRCTSVVDYCARWLLMAYAGSETPEVRP